MSREFSPIREQASKDRDFRRCVDLVRMGAHRSAHAQIPEVAGEAGRKMRHFRVLPESICEFYLKIIPGESRHADRESPFRQSEGAEKMKISARNVLEGTVKDIKKGSTTAHVTIDVKGLTVTASITNESVDDLGLKAGSKVSAVIKSSDVMVALA